MNPTLERVSVPRVWGVAALVEAAGDALQARFGTVQVTGEISAWVEAASGHRYFSLKDGQGLPALLRCAMFRRSVSGLDFAARDGLKVQAEGRLVVYEPRGDLQFVVESMRVVGSGSLYEEFLRLKARLSAQGLFDARRKRPLPAHPGAIGVISSLQAAALRDILTAVARRAPQVRVFVYPCLVQGQEAPDSIVRALEAAAARAEVDALILARGGGSLEDLWAFNDERVVRAVARASVPIVCGVGHETDVTLADFAADVRAATPTAAAELLTPVQQECSETLADFARRLRLSVNRAMDRRHQRLDQSAMAVLRPAQSLSRRAAALQHLQTRLAAGIADPLQRRALALHRLGGHLIAARGAQWARLLGRWQDVSARIQAQDPQAVLRRGYAWVSDASGRPLTSAQLVRVGDELVAVWHDGRAEIHVDSVSSPDT